MVIRALYKKLYCRVVESPCIQFPQAASQVKDILDIKPARVLLFLELLHQSSDLNVQRSFEQWFLVCLVLLSWIRFLIDLLKPSQTLQRHDQPFFVESSISKVLKELHCS